MKLYEVPRNSLIRIVGTDEVLQFSHIDGMYSYCINAEGHVVHIMAMAEVEVLEDQPQKEKA